MHVSPLNLKILAYTLELEGLDAQAMLDRFGFASIEAIPDEGAWVPVEVFDQMMAAAIEVSGDPGLGLVAGKSLAQMRYGVITPVAMFTPTLRQMVEDIRHFAPLLVQRSELELVETPQVACIVVNPLVHGGLSGAFRMEMVAANAINMVKFCGGGNADIFEVSFPYACPPGLEKRYAATFGPRTAFNRKDCAVTFDRRLLDVKMPSHDPVAYVAARTRVESALAARMAQTNVAERVRQWLLAAFPRQPSVAETAEHLGMSERSLRRQLWQVGVTHADLAQECQRLMAERLLADARLSLKEIADTLGFGSVSSFHRAFRRWAGVTPSGWREISVARQPNATDSTLS